MSENGEYEKNFQAKRRRVLSGALIVFALVAFVVLVAAGLLFPRAQHNEQVGEGGEQVQVSSDDSGAEQTQKSDALNEIHKYSTVELVAGFELEGENGERWTSTHAALISKEVRDAIVAEYGRDAFEKACEECGYVEEAVEDFGGGAEGFKREAVQWASASKSIYDAIAKKFGEKEVNAAIEKYGFEVDFDD